MAERDATLAQVVRRQLQRHLVASQNADVVLAHLASGIGHQRVAVFQRHAKARIGQHFIDFALHLDQVFFGQCVLQKKG